MALYRCGGGSNTPAPTLITKSITQNGTYNASDDNADGYSSVNVNVSGGGGGNCTINTKAQWDALSFAQKKAQGLTVIKESFDTAGEWFDYTNVSLPFTIRKECYQNSEGTATFPAMDNMIMFQGMWNNGAGNYDNLKFTPSSLTYDSKVDGSVGAFYYTSPFNKMVSILKNTSACNMSFRNGYSPSGYYSYGAIISVDDANADLSILGDYYDSQSHVVTLAEAYDGIIAITSKGYQNNREVNGLIEANGTYDSRYDGEVKLYSDITKACISVYSNVSAGTEFTITTPIGSIAGSAIIGVKLNNNNGG